MHGHLHSREQSLLLVGLQSLHRSNKEGLGWEDLPVLFLLRGLSSPGSSLIACLVCARMCALDSMGGGAPPVCVLY